MTPRPATALFALVCAGGFALALGLTVKEARHSEPVVADVARTSRTGLTTRVEVDVRNATSADRCTRARVVAQDRAGRDLGAADLGRLQLPARGHRRASATLALTASDYDERLTGFRVVLAGC